MVRAQGNHNFLLHLHDADYNFVGLGLGSHPSSLRRLPIFYRGAEWLYIRLVHLPCDQWLRRVSALRGRHNPVGVGDPGLLGLDVSPLRCNLDLDFQIQARDGSYEYGGLVRGAVCHQCPLLIHLCGLASHPSYQHSTRSMAIGRHFLWSLLFCHRPGDLVRLQRHHLQQCAALSRWPVLRHYL